ncbi:hypothetical protein Acsp04_43180 [Actinomadura sp. NBRC 104425]|uniref:hypothetical protein n=1 Tax=Actinomadura sp. NBRC 104425 TaxID=3032204 RepID=UPI0024A2EF9B|nr:hypothetical protein [Actinomadura sp. NBRC 104425]GLZ14083.1 hypothetical protein Acsp04_43180 [Actinomadura sp. NBRC 104425]
MGTDRMGAHDRLAALGTFMAAKGLVTKLTANGLRIANPQVNSGEEAADTVTCRPRPEDRDELWFYNGGQEPIAPAYSVIDAALHIIGHLNRRAGGEER